MWWLVKDYQMELQRALCELLAVLSQCIYSHEIERSERVSNLDKSVQDVDKTSGLGMNSL